MALVPVAVRVLYHVNAYMYRDLFNVISERLSLIIIMIPGAWLTNSRIHVPIERLRVDAASRSAQPPNCCLLTILIYKNHYFSNSDLNEFIQ